MGSARTGSNPVGSEFFVLFLVFFSSRTRLYLFFLSSLSRERVQYRKFLAGYQDRSEFGNCRKILADTKHRFNLALTESIGPRSTVSAVEARLQKWNNDLRGKIGLDSKHEFQVKNHDF